MFQFQRADKLSALLPGRLRQGRPHAEESLGAGGIHGHAAGIVRRAWERLPTGYIPQASACVDEMRAASARSEAESQVRATSADNAQSWIAASAAAHLQGGRCGGVIAARQRFAAAEGHDEEIGAQR